MQKVCVRVGVRVRGGGWEIFMRKGGKGEEVSMRESRGGGEHVREQVRR